MSEPALQREAILAALERLLASLEISRSPQLARFLDYIVQRTLEGNESTIKAYSIAVDVFGRAPDFDPQADPIVRVQARRLRGLLDDYYGGAGIDEPIQIRLPVGRYVPDFVAASQEATATHADPPSPPERTVRGALGPRLPVTWFILAAIAFAILLAAYRSSVWGPMERTATATGAVQQPSITVVEFQNLAGDSFPAPQVAGLAIELVTDLEQFGDITVRYGGGGPGSIATGDAPTTGYLLTGIVRQDGGQVQYSAILTESVSGLVVWNETFAVSPEEAENAGVLDTVSKSLSLVLGSPRGPLHAAARRYLASGSPPGGQDNLYLCRVLFDLYRETGTADDASRATACFTGLPEPDRETPDALASMASLMAETAVPATAADDSGVDPRRLAAENLVRAIGLDPISGFVWEQQARLQETLGALQQARADFSSAVQLNPANADALAAFARLLAFGGSLSEAEPLARQAVGGSPNPPPWYMGVPTLLALRDKNFEQAVVSAELYASADHELGPILAIIAAQQANDSAVVNRYLPQVLDVAAFRAEGILPRLRLRIADPDLLQAIRTSLVQAGVPPTALVQPF